ncbi:hypothetical protein, partial [Staphylococcus pseudintermedius]|uniref:hypothetical protein n=1 Tax=Staphylococcus pseudintermedius TaxID=283734 RepID=UPI000D9A16AE
IKYIEKSKTIKTETKINEILVPNKNNPLACEIKNPIIGSISNIETDCADLLVFILCEIAITNEIDRKVINGAINPPIIIQLRFGNTNFSIVFIENRFIITPKTVIEIHVTIMAGKKDDNI